ncbi:Pectate lyase [Phytophthora nicotianae]|nr:Pectate lyase [Phytophthora nicotianae]
MTTNIGSACWAAPEVLKDEATSEYSVKIDVYSFGVICWQLYTCAVPYADIPGSVLAVAEAVLSGVRPPIPRNCPRLFTKIMKRCWHDNPLRRPSFEDIVQLLEIELTEVRRRQLARAHGRGNDSVIAPPTLDSSNFDDTGRAQGMEGSYK